MKVARGGWKREVAAAGRRVGALVVCAAVLLGTAACAGARPAAAGHSAAGNRSVTLTWLIRNDLGQVQATWAQQTATAFEQQNPGVQVRIISEPSAQYNTKFLSMYAAGDSPDVIGTYAGGFGTFYAHQVMANISPYLKLLNVDLKTFMDSSVLGTMTRSGQLYGIPFSDPPTVLWYNATLFKKYHVPLPPVSWADHSWTIGTMLKDAQLLTHAGSTPANKTWGLIFGPDDLGATAWLWGADPFNNRGGPQDSQAYQTGVATQAYVDTGKFATAMTWLGDLIAKWHVSPPADVATEMGTVGGDPMMSGLIGMERVLITQTHVLAGSHPSFQWGIAPIPYGPAGDLVPTAPSGWVVSQQSKNKLLATKFIVYLTVGAAGASYAKIGGYVPANVRDRGVFFQKFASLPGNSQTLSADERVVNGGIAASQGWIYPQKIVNGGPQWQNTFNNTLANVWNGTESVAAGLSQLQKNFDSLLPQGA